MQFDTFLSNAYMYGTVTGMGDTKAKIHGLYSSAYVLVGEKDTKKCHMYAYDMI